MKTIIAMFIIGFLAGFALVKGIDGAGLATALAFIAGLGGYAIGRRRSQ